MLRFGEVYYKFSAKEKDEETSYSYFEARYLASDFSFWLSVDPLADKYPNISPYAYCAWNPVMLVDPDGRKVVDGNGKEVGIKIVSIGENKYTLEYTFANNTSQEIQNEFFVNSGSLFNDMVEIEEGRKAINNAINSVEKIHYTIANGDENNARITENGEIIGGVTKDIKNKDGKYMYTQVTIYEGSAKLWKSKNKFDQNKLTVNQKIATNAIHETFHATNETDINARKEERPLTPEEHKGVYDSGNKAGFEYGIINKAYE